MCFISFGPKSTADWARAAGRMGQATLLLEQQLETLTTGRAAVLVRPSSDQDGNQAKAEVEQALSGLTSSEARFDVEADETGHPWVVIRERGLPELTAAMQAVGAGLESAGLGDRIIAAVYPFHWKDDPVYWIYQSRLNAYTPFVPKGTKEGDERDHPLELRMEAALRRALPTSRHVAQWFPIWGMPI